jgi:GSH-dependent disulfide-bond oxidoreductase
MIELYHFEPNAESLKLLIALKEKNLSFESRYVDLLDLAHHADAFKDAADGGRVPLLVQDGEAHKDSQLTLEYLAEAYEPRLAPTDPAGWYDVQAWTAQLDQALSQAVRLVGWHTVTLPAMSEAQRTDFLDRAARLEKPHAAAGWAQVTSDAEASEDQLTLAREKIADMVLRIEKTLQTSDWLVGGAYSVADINAFALTHTLPRLTPELVNAQKTPKLMAWLRRVGDRAAVKDALAMRTRSDLGQDVYAPAA